MAKLIPDNLMKSVVAEHLMGQPFTVLAQKYEVSLSTIASIWRRYKTNAGADAVEPQELAARLKDKAYVAIEAGLDDTTDSYKRGGLGVKVLQGTGEFQSGDTVNVQINNLIQNVPEDWKGRYISNDSDTFEMEAPDEK